MVRQSKRTAQQVKELEKGQGDETIVSREQTQNSVPVPKGVSERRWRRRNDLTTVHGLAREHQRLIAAMHSGRIPLESGDILSRTYGRQREIIATSEIKRSLDNLAQQIADIKNEQSVVSDQFPLVGIESP